MSKVNGIYAATLSVLNDDLSLNIKKTINHAENVMELGCHGVVFFGSTARHGGMPQISDYRLVSWSCRAPERE